MSSFTRFVFGSRQNRLFFWIAIGLFLTEWILFKIAYPFPDFFSDSYSYIEAAMKHLDINIWPIGYSKFLIVFHGITHSDTALVSFQFIFLELAALYFFFTLRYLYKPGIKTSIVIFVFLFCNPLFLYISNYVTADSLFCAITIVWITEALWIMERPSVGRIVPQAICIFIAYTFRYNAMYYPIITAVAFGLSRQKIWIKSVGIVLPCLLILLFLGYSRNAGEKLTGKPIYSILSGWQLANNALYFYGMVQVDSTKLPNKDCVELDSITRFFFRTAKPGYMVFLAHHQGNYFIQDWAAPLKLYMTAHYKENNQRSWGSVSPLFSTYGSYLIKTFPGAYLKYFVLMNTRNYFIPPLEKLRTYNMGLDYVWGEARDWFRYKSPDVKHPPSNFQEQLLFIFCPLFLIINLFFPLSALWFLATGKHKKADPAFNKALILISCFWAINFLFSITANIIALRYEFFPMILIFSFSIFLYEYVITSPKQHHATKTN